MATKRHEKAQVVFGSDAATCSTAAVPGTATNNQTAKNALTTCLALEELGRLGRIDGVGILMAGCGLGETMSQINGIMAGEVRRRAVVL